MLVSQKVAAGIYCGVTTTELDELAAETAAAMTSTHPDYALVSSCICDEDGRASSAAAAVARTHAPLPVILSRPLSPNQHKNTQPQPQTQLAARIAVSNLHKNTLKSFSET